MGELTDNFGAAIINLGQPLDQPLPALVKQIEAIPGVTSLNH